MYVSQDPLSFKVSTSTTNATNSIAYWTVGITPPSGAFFVNNIGFRNPSNSSRDSVWASTRNNSYSSYTFTRRITANSWKSATFDARWLSTNAESSKYIRLRNVTIGYDSPNFYTSDYGYFDLILENSGEETDSRIKIDRIVLLDSKESINIALSLFSYIDYAGNTDPGF